MGGGRRFESVEPPGHRAAAPVLAPPLVGRPDDRYEREADRVAGRVASWASRSSAPRPVAPIRSAPGAGGRGVIRRSADGAAPQAVAVAARRGGRPVPAPVLAPLERSLGDDLGDVRVHTDAAADQLARTLGAVAFTTGQDIFFRRGRYDPGTQPGRHLLAHELTHVVQQRGTGAPPVQRKMGLEYELDDIHTRHTLSWGISPSKTWIPHDAGGFMMARTDYELGADTATAMLVPRSHIEFRTRPFDETKSTEVAKMIAAVTSILNDIHAIKLATHAHPRKGYGAGNSWVGGGAEGWFARDEWVGLNEIPRLRGPWYHQVTYAGKMSKDAVGTLQLTGGFSLRALQRLVSGQQLGSIPTWPPAAQYDARQYLHGYARQARKAPKLYRVARRAVEANGLDRGGVRGATDMMAAILTVMAQLPLSERASRYDAGYMIAKTDYAKILSMASGEGIQFDHQHLLQALLDVVNHFIHPATVNGNSPVTPDTGPPDLTKVSFQQWITALKPPRPRRGAQRPAPMDLMTKANYPGTPAEKAGLRAFGPYRHADPGRDQDDSERAIFELRGIMSNPSGDLVALTNALVALMHALH